ncbi:eukaryotic translation initiation factor 2D-like isoform X1 [Ctenopharyngodon idella]|uniref:eukaryotic translation initiation factor 2D-like isoform X1 n=2 Tax=Ctenopharyngodon idella TaxID=7959 RepID=UPI00222F3515|nr:eukaryotic translation initiation factor 2D-like isoform X1 [Ctenopharyngodon idella]
MFAKAFRVKSNTVIKGSDRRKLRTDISAAFPSLSVQELNELIPNKEELNIVKIYAHKGDSVTLYVLHKNPIFFQLEKQLFPTVYTLWRCPTMLPAFTTWPPVLQKLSGGADLMLPGVVVSASGLPEVHQGDCCAVTLVMNRAPVAVGTAAVSSAEMRKSGMKGKGVNILHAYMDQLWAFGDKTHPPVIPVTNSPAQVEGETEGEECVEKEEVKDGSESVAVETSCQSMQELRLDEHEVLKEEQPVDDKEGEDTDGEEHDSKSPQEQMDELLLQCFLHALKTKVKKSDLPLLTSTFLSKHMVSCCPRGKQLDIKKSSYKKLSKFLLCMQRDHSLVQVKELSKGVESIVEVYWRNPELCSFSTPEDCGPEKESVEGSGACEVPYQPPEITQLYGVTARLEPLFQDAKKKKGMPLKASEVRNIITDYVKKNDLVHETNKNYVNINPALCDCLLEKSEYHEVETLKWDDLFSRTLIRMQACHEVLFPGQPPVVKKGQMEPIDITVASRGSNKKVTVIKNLEAFGLDPAVVADTLQRQVQASCVLNESPGAKNRVLVQIQGNQVQHVGKLLLDRYQIPRKYVQGLDKAPKPGKKK